MIGAALELPNFKEFMKDLENGDTARDFIQQILEIGYTIDEVKPGVDLRTLPEEYVIHLAQRQWTVVYLTEYPNYGEFEQ